MSKVLDELITPVKMVEVVTTEGGTETTFHQEALWSMRNKINEIIEVINKKEDDYDYSDDIEEVKKIFPKQTFYKKEWIGKLCKVWDEPETKDRAEYRVLLNIFEDEEYPFCVAEGGLDIEFRYCEPVTNNDDILISNEYKVCSWENGIPSCGGTTNDK